MTKKTETQVKKDKRNVPEYIKEPTQLFRGMGLSDGHKRLASHLIYFTFDGTKDFTTSSKDLQDLLEWKSRDKVEEALANLTVRRMITREATPNGSIIRWNSNQEEWIRELKEEHWIDALNHGVVTKYGSRRCRKNQQPEGCRKNQQPLAGKTSNLPDEVAGKTSNPCWKNQQPSHTYREGIEENSNKEEREKKEPSALALSFEGEGAKVIEDDFEVACEFEAYYRKYFPNAVIDTHAQEKAIAKIRELTGHNKDQIMALLVFIDRDKFWKRNKYLPSMLLKKDESGRTIYEKIYGQLISTNSGVIAAIILKQKQSGTPVRQKNGVPF